MEFTIGNGSNINNAMNTITETTQTVANAANVANNVAKTGDVKMVGVFFAIIGIVMAIVGAVIMNLQTGKIERATAETTSTNVEVGRFMSDDGEWMYRPLYTYVVDGKVYECESTVSSTTSPSTSNATVYYNPDKPNECVTEHDKNGSGFLYFVFIGLGILFVVIGVGFTIFTKKTKPTVAA